MSGRSHGGILLGRVCSQLPGVAALRYSSVAGKCVLVPG